jgi:hypothetical protein
MTVLGPVRTPSATKRFDVWCWPFPDMPTHQPNVSYWAKSGKHGLYNEEAADIGARSPNAKGFWNKSRCDDVDLQQAPSGATSISFGNLERRGSDAGMAWRTNRRDHNGSATRRDRAQCSLVLVWSTVGVIVAFVIVYFLFSGDPSLSSDLSASALSKAL